MGKLKAFLNNDIGATAMEYGLAALLVSVVAIAAMRDGGEEVNGLYVQVEGAVTEAAED